MLSAFWNVFGNLCFSFFYQKFNIFSEIRCQVEVLALLFDINLSEKTWVLLQLLFMNFTKIIPSGGGMFLNILEVTLFVRRFLEKSENRK